MKKTLSTAAAQDAQTPTPNEILEAHGMAIKIGEFDHCLIGACKTWHGDRLVNRLIYDMNSMLDTLMNRDKISKQEASEYLYYKIIEAYAGPTMPIVMWQIDVPPVTH
jgi:hypothetical protein